METSEPFTNKFTKFDAKVVLSRVTWQIKAKYIAIHYMYCNF